MNRFSRGVILFVTFLFALFFKLDESIGHDVPSVSLGASEEMHKSQANVIDDKPIRSEIIQKEKIGPLESESDFLKEERERAKNSQIKVVTMSVTAYCVVPKGIKNYHKLRKINGTGRSFNGKKLRKGDIAADLRLYPAGTVMLIPKIGKVTVADKGGDIVGDRIDIFMGSGREAYRAAKNFGRQELKVIVLSDG